MLQKWLNIWHNSTVKIMQRSDRMLEWNRRDISVGMKSERLWTVEHRQIGNESTNFFKFLQPWNLVADIELELVIKDGIWEPDLKDGNSTLSSLPYCSTCQHNTYNKLLWHSVITHGSRRSKAITRICVCVCVCVILSVCLFVCTIKPKRQKLNSPNLAQG